jgi:hypothetical protein
MPETSYVGLAPLLYVTVIDVAVTADSRMY